MNGFIEVSVANSPDVATSQLQANCVYLQTWATIHVKVVLWLKKSVLTRHALSVKRYLAGFLTFYQPVTVLEQTLWMFEDFVTCLSRKSTEETDKSKYYDATTATVMIYIFVWQVKESFV